MVPKDSSLSRPRAEEFQMNFKVLVSFLLVVLNLGMVACGGAKASSGKVCKTYPSDNLGMVRPSSDLFQSISCDGSLLVVKNDGDTFRFLELVRKSGNENRGFIVAAGESIINLKGEKEGVSLQGQSAEGDNLLLVRVIFNLDKGHREDFFIYTSRDNPGRMIVARH